MKEFENTRAILTRSSDEQSYYGWVQPGIEGQILLKVEPPPEFTAGEVFTIELHSAKHSTRFDGTYRGSKQDLLVFTLPNLIMMDAPKGSARFKRQAIRATAFKGTDSFEGQLLDLGSSGGAVITKASFESGEKLQIRVQVDDHIIDVDGEVIYSRFEQEADGVFRTGFKISRMSRIDQARWNQLLTA